ncbi:hypothetical protein [uncultured Psychrobacter sp.]|uniref:hypothetical protein n=1 Tax=uncultured Psychrobacter sp. TaxID=259303 RepID=UPI00259A1CE4|nr:hypothetical protein [uncultured Psychrobacter sp.]
MLDFYTLQKTLTALSNDEHTYTATDIATLCRAGKLTPLFSYNRYAMELMRFDALSAEYDITSIAPFYGYLTHRKLLDLLDGYSEKLALNDATVFYDANSAAKDYEVILLAKPFDYCRYSTDDNYSPFSDDDSLTVTSEQLLFSREQVEALARQPQAPQRHRAQTDETNTDKKLIAIMALLLAKQSNTFRIGQKPNYKQINEAILNLATDLKIANEDMRGLQANADKISKAVQAYADMFKLSKD